MKVIIKDIQPVLHGTGYRDASVYMLLDEDKTGMFTAGVGGHTVESHIPFMVSEVTDRFVNIVPFFDHLGLRTPIELYNALMKNKAVELWV